MELPVVVGVDGSDSSLRAVDWAADEAARHGLPLRLVYVSRWERYEAASLQSLERPSEQVLADSIVTDAAARAEVRNPEVTVTAEVLAQDTVTALLDEGHRATMLVTGSRGRGQLKELLLGSVSLAVAARAHCPVVVVRGDAAGTVGAHGRILLGVADPARGTAAVAFAFREAAVRKCEIDAVRSWRRPGYEGTGLLRDTSAPGISREMRAETELDQALGPFLGRHPDVAVRRSTVEGPAHQVLVHRSAAADLLVVGAPRRHGRVGLQIGRTAHAALHHAHCPVAVVPQPQ
ncbi:universal stress protein [Streptomyces sp. NPDC001981]|uniref:universal stress protein n=1 Tax=Streptomyces sp. NPDC001981 TaxID=3364628 RepID=UPI0036C402D7